MVVISYLLGRRYYPVPYEVGRVLGYVLLGLGLYLASGQLETLTGLRQWVIGTVLLGVFFLLVYVLDARKLLRGRASAGAGAS